MYREMIEPLIEEIDWIVEAMLHQEDDKTINTLLGLQERVSAMRDNDHELERMLKVEQIPSDIRTLADYNISSFIAPIRNINNRLAELRLCLEVEALRPISAK